jgi:thiosulfate/3-mercaptopyruvate sulfurtransferase
VLDVRWRLAGPPGRDDFTAGHVPGAVFVDLDTELAAPVRPDRVGGRHPLPTAEVFQAAMRGAGVRIGETVVTVDDGDGSAAARAWWCLRYFGHGEVRILAGGWRAWVAAGGAVTDATPQAEPGDFVARAGGLPVVDAAGAEAVARGAGVLVDVRTAVRFRGEQEPVDPVAGHIPGAVNLPAGQVVTEDGWVAQGVLRAQLESVGAGDGAVVASCGSGVTAAVLVAALARDGVEAALYAGSWSDWISDPSRPVARGE